MFSESIEHEGNKLLSYDIALYSSIHFEHPLQSLVDSFVGPSEPRCQYSSQLSWRIADSNSGSIVGRVEGLSQNKAKQNHRNVSWGDPTIWHNQPESLRYGWWKLKQTTIQEKDCTDQIWKGMQRMIYIYTHMNYFLKIGPRTCLGNIWNVNTDMTGIISLTNAHKHMFTWNSGTYYRT